MSEKTEKSLAIPEWLDEKETLRVINEVARYFSPKFTFSTSIGVEDTEQEARVICLQALHEFDPSRPLKKYLLTVCRNRLNNFRRKHYTRADAPCMDCHRAIPGMTKHEGGKYCQPYLEWKQRNDTKKNLARPFDLEARETNKFDDADVPEEVHLKDMMRLIDDCLPLELRKTYLKILAKQHVPTADRQRVREAIKVIIGHDPDLEDE